MKSSGLQLCSYTKKRDGQEGNLFVCMRVVCIHISLNGCMCIVWQTLLIVMLCNYSATDQQYCMYQCYITVLFATAFCWVSTTYKALMYDAWFSYNYIHYPIIMNIMQQNYCISNLQKQNHEKNLFLSILAIYLCIVISYVTAYFNI